MFALGPSLAVFALGPACARTDVAPDTPADTARSESARAEPTDSLGRLDLALSRHWADAGVEPSALSSDAEFLRRASLDLLGRVPTQVEVEAFLAEQGADKRSVLVDTMLRDERFSEHWAQLWTAQLIPREQRARRTAERPMQTFLADALTQNRAWDAVVTDLLTGEGALGDDPSLALLAARDLRGPTREAALAELTSTSARVFLGARIECAQCHDHPYVDFSREDFWATAAFFGRTTVRRNRDVKPPEITVGERARGDLRIALGEGDDPRKLAIAPRYMGADTGANMDTGTGPIEGPRRGALAAAIVDDPRFAQATVGQVWARRFGRGIVEPWDDLLELSLSENKSEGPPALLDELAADFRDHGHDLRHLLRTIVLSQAYQRSSRGGPDTSLARQPDASLARERAFAQAAVRPLSAEQLFASLITATGLEEVGGRAFRNTVRSRKNMALREFEFVFSDDEMSGADSFTGSVAQALLVLNGGLSNQGVVARPGSSLARILEAQGDTDARLEDLWLTVYGRLPSDAELALGRGLTADADDDSGDDAWEDLMFAMLYSSEFASNH